MNTKTKNNVIVRVELFGHARTVAGVRDLKLALPRESGVSDMAAALAAALPSLLSVVLDPDGSRLLPATPPTSTASLSWRTLPIPISRAIPYTSFPVRPEAKY